jgi:hypothetical protein
MSGLLKHWFGTDRGSVIKSISNKPIKITTRDAVIITILTVVSMLIITMIYFNVTDTPAADRNYGSLAAQTALTSMAAQYFYEYSGANNMIAESSLRYAKGSTLDKYVSRREAVIYECLYKLLNSPKYKDREELIRRNFNILLVVLTNPDLCGKMMDLAKSNGNFNGNVTISNTNNLEQLRKKYTAADVDMLLTLPQQTILALNTISDHINEEMVYDILVNGLTDYKLSDNPVFSTLAELPPRDKIEL